MTSTTEVPLPLLFFISFSFEKTGAAIAAGGLISLHEKIRRHRFPRKHVFLPFFAFFR
jgi:hypothetical protein